MKTRKTLIGIVIIIAITALVATLTASCLSTETKGDSAYDIAVKNGFEGTEAEWLESLKGTDGTDGKDGTDGVNGTDGKDAFTLDELVNYYLENNPGSTIEDFYASLGLDVTPSITSTVQQALKSSVGIICTNARSTSSGSGVIYKLSENKAYIITNYHVIFDSSTGGYSNDIKVYLYNQVQEEDLITATVVGASRSNDIAVIEAQSDMFLTDTVAAVKVNTSTPTVGQATFAIGTPSLYTFSVTSGIVSVETEYIATKYSSSVRVYRTDAALNSGNSGGGMFNEYGELMGISDAKSSDTTDDNVCYAIPASLAVAVADNIIENGGQRFVLGISRPAAANTYPNNAEDVVDISTYVDENGVILTAYTYKIYSVGEGTAAYGKLIEGDVLVSISVNGGEAVKIDAFYKAQETLMGVKAGDSVTVNVLRDGQPVAVTITAEQAHFTAI